MCYKHTTFYRGVVVHTLLSVCQAVFLCGVFMFFLYLHWFTPTFKKHALETYWDGLLNVCSVFTHCQLGSPSLIPQSFHSTVN